MINSMYDVFISYRSGDAGWAGRLRDDLVANNVAVFYSGTSLDPGDDWTERIQSALEGCRVFLAVIGKEWVSGELLASLANEGKVDWVRRELQEAFARPEIKIIPVLVDVRAIPDLPPSLVTLKKREAFQLTDKQWTIEIADLRQNLQERLADSPRRLSGATGLLPFLCDRLPQEDALSALSSGNSTGSPRSVVVLPGHWLEAHDGFLERVTRLKKLEQLLGASRAGVDPPIPLQWELKPIGEVPEDARKQAYDTFLSRTLKRALFDDPGSAQDLDGVLSGAVKPRLFVLDVTSDDISIHGRAFLGELSSAWNRLVGRIPRTGASSAVRLLLWISVEYFDSDRDGEVEVLEACRLPKLEQITRPDVVQWLGRPDVKQVAAPYRRELIALVDEARECCGRGRIHMQCFADQARKLLKAS